MQTIKKNYEVNKEKKVNIIISMYKLNVLQSKNYDASPFALSCNNTLLTEGTEITLIGDR